MKIAPAKKRLLAYAGIIGSFALLSIVFFSTSQFQKAKATASRTQFEGASKELTKLDDEEQKVLNNKDLSEVEKTVALRVIDDKRDWYSGIKNYFEKENEKNARSYKLTAIPAYSCSLLALVSFGLCLKHEDKAKAKEEDAQ